MGRMKHEAYFEMCGSRFSTMIMLGEEAEAQDLRKCKESRVGCRASVTGVMKHTSNSRLLETLREREFQLFALRRSLDELRDKFFQLENAFGINLRAQMLLENELELLKLGNIPSEVENEMLNVRTKLRSSVKKIRGEKEEWKRAFLRQRKIIETQNLKHSRSIETIRWECENILKTCRQSGERHFQELLQLCEDSRKKAKLFDEARKAAQARENLTRNRILELANLLETLEMFKGVRIEMLCHRSAEVLKSLATVNAEFYEDEMRKLRQVTWDVREKYENDESLEFLQDQNSVLRQVVKSLKKKAKFNGENEKFTKFAEETSDPEGNFEGSESDDGEKSKKLDKNYTVSLDETRKSKGGEEKSCDDIKIPKNLELTTEEDAEKCDSRSSRNTEVLNCSDEITHEIQLNRRGKQSEERDQITKRIYVDAIESHRNGIPCEEYSIHLFDDRKLRFRQCSALERKDSTLLIEFVNSEEDFQEAPLNRTVFYLGDRVESIIRIERSIRHCGAQTCGVKRYEKSVQTTTTGVKRFFRVNAGVGMLNSEKRAIERSLANLERTVSSLKENVLGEALSMIGRDAKILDNELFDCVKRLER